MASIISDSSHINSSSSLKQASLWSGALTVTRYWYSMLSCYRWKSKNLIRQLHWVMVFFFLSAIVCPWLNFGLPPRCPQAVWCLWEKIEPFSATLAQDGLAECDQPAKSLEILRRGWELNPGHGEDRQWAIPLSYHDPGHREVRQWAIPLSYHDPGHREDRQGAIPLSYHDCFVK